MRAAIFVISILLIGTASMAHGEPIETTARYWNATTPHIRALLTAYGAGEEDCRGGSGDLASTQIACRRRDGIGRRLEAARWCFGEGAADGASSYWAPCKRKSSR
jgi:hypothetical protein